ncbi:MFS transporter [Pseudoclavibacter helvolus]|uniref:UMF1 family MFS transporter n=1 Tax=Pseudoclavibacter helvolus TaxID=255205 RepID=A0A7W4UP70_9MICO|nr:MFS transporter [Pseudoclavibacter helvolus]MBB2957971.1 UMF1 family MFS transporter [Pseudoclavibacter helvolus]
MALPGRADEGAPSPSDPTPSGRVETVDGGAAVTPKELKKRATAWALWDVGNSAFQAVVVTFVFATYLASDLFIDPQVAALGDANPLDPQYLAAQAASTNVIANLSTVAGLLVALIAPVLGQRSDGSGRRKLWLGIFTAVTVVIMLAMFFIQPGEEYLFWGALLLAVGTIFAELSGVNYNAMLSQVSTPKNVGRISGIGWGLGYLGSIVLLVLLLVLFIQSFGVEGRNGVLAVPSGVDGGALDIRFAIVLAAVWYVVFALPVMFKVPEIPKDTNRPKVSFFASYGVLFRVIGKLAKSDPKLLLFLAASAVFRDGLQAIFAFGAILAAQVYGFAPSEVIYFAVAANLVAGLGTLAAGWFDDRFGPKLVIMASLVSLTAFSVVLIFLPSEQTVFWIFGLALCLFVGPAQAASRSYLSRATPPGREGELFGLYATTNRVASFITPALFSLFVFLSGNPKMGIIGIGIVLAVGFLMMLPVPSKVKQASA